MESVINLATIHLASFRPTSNHLPSKSPGSKIWRVYTGILFILGAIIIIFDGHYCKVYVFFQGMIKIRYNNSHKQNPVSIRPFSCVLQIGTIYQLKLKIRTKWENISKDKIVNPNYDSSYKAV